MMSSYLARSNRLYTTSHIPDDQRSGYDKEVQIANEKRQMRRDTRGSARGSSVTEKSSSWKMCSCFEPTTMKEKEKIFEDNIPF